MTYRIRCESNDLHEQLSQSRLQRVLNVTVFRAVGSSRNRSGKEYIGFLNETYVVEDS